MLIQQLSAYYTSAYSQHADVLRFVLLSLRYRKQMEEMQRAFNKTIIKLQNTSRIAEEQVSTVFYLHIQLQTARRTLS